MAQDPRLAEASASQIEALKEEVRGKYGLDVFKMGLLPEAFAAVATIQDLRQLFGLSASSAAGVQPFPVRSDGKRALRSGEVSLGGKAWYYALWEKSDGKNKGGSLHVFGDLEGMHIHANQEFSSNI